MGSDIIPVFASSISVCHHSHPVTVTTFLAVFRFLQSTETLFVLSYGKRACAHKTHSCPTSFG